MWRVAPKLTKDYSSPWHYTTGDPSLRTPSDQQVMLLFAADDHVSLTLMYERVDDAIYYAHGVDEGNVTWSKPENADYEQALVASLELDYDPTKWWKAKVQLTAMQMRFATPEETFDGDWGGKFLWNNTFNFFPSFGGSLSAYWETGTTLENHVWRPVGNVGASLWKSLCGNRLRFSLESTAWARGRKSKTLGDGYVSYYHNTTDRTSLTFSIRWNFSSGRKVHRRAGADSIQQYDKIEENAG